MTDAMMKINTLSELPPYQEGDSFGADCSTWSECQVVREEERCGVVGSGGSILLPLEYDNVSVVGFGVLLLVKHGKMGMAFLDREDEEDPFFLQRLIPCEYDYIQTGNCSAGSYPLHKMTADGNTVRAYMRKPDILTDEYDRADTVISPKTTVDCQTHSKTSFFLAILGTLVSD